MHSGSTLQCIQIVFRTSRDELREPLLANGAADDVEAGPPAKVPPPPPSTSADSDDEAEIEEDGYLARLGHLWSSPLVATSCCIFLCYILKVLQQVRAAHLCSLPFYALSTHAICKG